MYDQVIEFVKAAGERLREKAGALPDIGVRKKWLTEEDLRIEREFGELIKTFGAGHKLYAEEEHESFEATEHVWAMDPISGTALFLRGLPHYSIVISHIQNGETEFATVYDPSARELYSAERGKGCFLNNIPAKTAITDVVFPKITFHVAETWKIPEMISRFSLALKDFNMYRTSLSIGAGYGYVATGKFEGMIALTKDSFPDFAGSLLVREAGGVFTNIEGSPDIKPTDQTFVAAHPSIHGKLLDIARRVLA